MMSLGVANPYSYDDEDKNPDFKKTSLAGVRSSGFLTTQQTTSPASLEGTFKFAAAQQPGKDEFPARASALNAKRRQGYGKNRDLMHTNSLSSQASSRQLRDWSSVIRAETELSLNSKDMPLNIWDENKNS